MEKSADFSKIQYAPQIDQLTILSMNFTFSWSADRKWKKSADFSKIQYAPQIDQLTILSMISTFSWWKLKNQLHSVK